MTLHKLIELNVECDRDTFRQILVNTRYHHSILGEEIKRLEEAGFTAQADGIGPDQIVEELRVCDVQGSEWDYRNTCRCILYLDNRWDFATSSLFIVLPADLDSWDDMDPSTHHFRLYFLCDVWLRDGLKDRNYGIPALDPQTFLWDCDPMVLGKVSEDNIIRLVDKAIAYLQELSPPRWSSKLELTRAQSAKIKEYLVVQDGDVGGGLHRRLEVMEGFVHSRGGHLDFQKATLRVELESAIAAEQFRIILKDTKHRFDISVKLSWKASQSDIEQLCYNIANTKAFVLEIDGVTLDAHPQDQVQHMCDLFGNIIQQDRLRFISLLNYPRPLEQCLGGAEI
ncbi:hypothetical protein BGZ81_004913 [Podila clonocystis]|nr:hypothetical protein BGZ81_004913 [Podila clonocystis]